ncbi:hypothetical protein B0T25DRAFT_589950 [Lasiosphaeria hispida]|uniref:ATP-dependent RNA helicase DRS1 n=1 Tax=Lasiosphaeria hispida TaxID=260671 RepID=A0AAJ0HMR4_9PEZI|nr:hypothetical protein B0T25DRAFT_589950 [Lasiosphaeria hispida]
MRKQTADDDFILTIPDEADIPEETIVAAAAPPKKKAKTTNKKKNKKGKKFDDQDGDSDAEDEEEEGPVGIWGQNDDDDGAMDSDFEFVVPDVAKELDPADFDGWGFEGAKKGMSGNEKQAVDIDEIIRRRREKREAKGLRKNGGKAPAADPVVEAEAEADAMDFDLDDDNDEVLAEDAFGMGVGSDVDEEEDQKMADREDEEDDEEEGDSDDYEDEDDAAASDNDSVATPVQHPDDDGSASEEEEDAEEEAKRRDFFAPEEKEVPGRSGGPATFQGMSLSRPILRGLTTVGFTKPTPIQAKTIPISLMGKDVVGGAVTGSGKTAAFVVPILERLLYRPKKVPTTRVVIMMPTRELAIQCHSVAAKLASHTDIKFCLAVGGLSLKVQEAELRLRPDVVIATPGRFIDHMRNSASFTVDTVEILVLDEADRMLEDGFADELNEILTTLPKSRQTMLFSATMTSSVDSLIRVGLNKPVRIMVDTKKKTVMTLTQEFVRLRPGREEKRMGYLAEEDCSSMPYHLWPPWLVVGGASWELEPGSDGKVSYLLATDLASRGLDIKGIDTVINYEAPQSLDIYVHRVGRTARAGRSGVAITLAAEPDRKVVKAAVRAGKSQGSKIISRVIEAAEADKWQDQIDGMEDEIEAIMQEEKEEKQIAQVEMQVKKGENLIKHEEEIQARPRRTWFETEKNKKDAKEAGRAELNGVRDKLKKKGEAGRLSNKDKKKLDTIAERGDGKSWKKGRAERDGKGAVLNFKKDKSDKPKTKPPPRKVAGPAKKAFRGKKSLLRYLVPATVRARYREKLSAFRLDTLPQYKSRLQSGIYRFLVARQHRRSSQTRPMTRRNRMLIGLARRLSGIPAPYAQGAEQAPVSMHEEHERMREEQRIAKEAQEIERKGKGEEEIANRGGYSEPPKDDTDSDTETGNHGGGVGTRTAASPPGSPVLAGRNPLPPTSEMTEAELAVANANLMARIGPFMTTPLVQLPITIFFYNEDQSQSRTIMTNDSGHFTIRAALDFVPTHVRVLANENISAVEPIQIIETRGVSLISDIDDTIKRSNIHLGAREIFRNTFIRDLADLTIDGVREWYRGLSEMGVKIHYCSNSPWQLFPVLATYFLIAGLPQGTIHLKHYSGMLQGIFEPVAERKKGTLERILRDFPERKFLLVGDSGEADLEVYTELAVANPGRILAVFIRDVTTPDQVGYFDSSFNANPSQRVRREDNRGRFEELPMADNAAKRPSLPPRVQTAPSNTGPVMGTLIDLTDESEEAGTSQLKATTSNVDILSRKPPPPRPAKPPALRSAPSDLGVGASNRGGRPTMPPNPRAPRPPGSDNGAGTHPLSQIQNSSNQTLGSSNSGGSFRTPNATTSQYPGSSPSSSHGSRPTPPPPPSRRRVTSSLTNAGSEAGDWEAMPAAAMLGHPGATDVGMGQNSAGEPINKKVDLWRRRLARAHEMLDGQGVKLYTWRRGQDVIREAEGIVREAMR